MEPEEKNPDSKYGESRKFDPNFKGPIQDRGCTDILCCLLFILFLFGYFAVGILAWSQGDPRKVIYPTDSRGQFCGQAGTALEKKPFLFYFNILKCASPLVLLEFQCPTPQICVEKCPDRHLNLVKAKLGSNEDREYYSRFCKEGTDFTALSPPEILRDALCPAMLLPSKAFTRRCLPALGKLSGGVVVVGNETSFLDDENNRVNATDLLEASKKSNVVVEARQVAMRIFEDYTQSWHWILLGLVIAMVVSLIFVVLLRFLAAFMVWVIIILVILVIGYGIFHCYMEYAALKGEPGADVTIRDLGLQTDFSVYLQIRQTWLAFMIILAIVEFIVILLLIFLRKRILIAIALIKEASRSVHVGCGTFSSGCVACSGVSRSKTHLNAEPLSQENFLWKRKFAHMNVLVHPKVLHHFPSRPPGAQNKFAKFLLSCMKCCFWCLEKCIRFLNRNAYIMIAIYGKNFCASARDAFFLLMRNIIRVAVLDKVTDFLLFLGKLLIVGIVGIFSFFFFSGRIKAVEDAAPSLNYYWVPILTVVVGSYLIAHGFFSVYAMCVDTLFLCFCEDLERNDGSSERPYFMSPELHEILSKTRKVEDECDGVEAADAAKQADEVKVDEETPLQQQDGEVQLKQQTVLKEENEEKQPVESITEDKKKEKEEEEQVSQAEDTEKKEEPAVKEAAAKQEVKAEEKAAEQPAAAGEAEEVKKVEEKEQPKDDNPPPAPQE
ncbi:choline transporter-like protein 2 [Poecilia formosa]|uniref:choline transporter-like protein 2 n=1 Tax=Poecilia formosa TaxID=48698 RepID=UPI0007B8A72F|nr:PREDICTED: choline transporter-like protein 2 [Poecilia formosa]